MERTMNTARLGHQESAGISVSGCPTRREKESSTAKLHRPAANTLGGDGRASSSKHTSMKRTEPVASSTSSPRSGTNSSSQGVSSEGGASGAIHTAKSTTTIRAFSKRASKKTPGAVASPGTSTGSSTADPNRLPQAPIEALNHLRDLTASKSINNGSTLFSRESYNAPPVRRAGPILPSTRSAPSWTDPIPSGPSPYEVHRERHEGTRQRKSFNPPSVRRRLSNVTLLNRRFGYPKPSSTNSPSSDHNPFPSGHSALDTPHSSQIGRPAQTVPSALKYHPSHPPLSAMTTSEFPEVSSASNKRKKAPLNKAIELKRSKEEEEQCQAALQACLFVLQRQAEHDSRNADSKTVLPTSPRPHRHRVQVDRGADLSSTSTRSAPPRTSPGTSNQSGIAKSTLDEAPLLGTQSTQSGSSSSASLPAIKVAQPHRRVIISPPPSDASDSEADVDRIVPVALSLSLSPNPALPAISDEDYDNLPAVDHSPSPQVASRTSSGELASLATAYPSPGRTSVSSERSAPFEFPELRLDPITELSTPKPKPRTSADSPNVTRLVLDLTARSAAPLSAPATPISRPRSPTAESDGSADVTLPDSPKSGRPWPELVSSPTASLNHLPIRTGPPSVYTVRSSSPAMSDTSMSDSSSSRSRGSSSPTPLGPPRRRRGLTPDLAPNYPARCSLSYYPGKNFGLRADEDLKPGDIIVREAPFIRILHPILSHRLHESFSRLSSRHRILFLSFTATVTNEPDIYVSLAETNCIPLVGMSKTKGKVQRRPAGSSKTALVEHVEKVQSKRSLQKMARKTSGIWSVIKYPLEQRIPGAKPRSILLGAEDDDGPCPSGIFETICRANHSCSPNSGWVWDEVNEEMLLMAYDNIPKGEEVTAAYSNAWETIESSSDRRAKLLKQFGFECGCDACPPSTVSAESAEAVKAIEAVDKDLRRLKHLTRDIDMDILDYCEFPQQRIRELNEAIDICRRHKKTAVLCEILPQLYYFHALWGDVEQAKVAAREAAEMRRITFGPLADFGDEVTFSELAEKPQLWKTWKKALQVWRPVNDVSGDNDSDFEPGEEKEIANQAAEFHTRRSNRRKIDDAVPTGRPKRMKLSVPATSAPIDSSRNAEHSEPEVDVTHEIEDSLSEDGLPPKEAYCQWEGCSRSEAFDDIVGLVNHLHAEHIVKGRDHCCFWKDCPRKGQKQATRQFLKLHCRSHTGERPYRCAQPDAQGQITHIGKTHRNYPDSINIHHSKVIAGSLHDIDREKVRDTGLFQAVDPVAAPTLRLQQALLGPVYLYVYYTNMKRHTTVYAIILGHCYWSA